MHKIAILGFGVVGGGVADLITNNKKEVESLAGDAISISYILDLRDFPDSPFADRVVHDFNVIINDETVDTVIEVMGGSHPAYEYTVAALSAGKNVITSNKEVVANFGDEFLALAKEKGVVYRFEAAVGGGIPVLSPLISHVKQNKIREVRGILNGTTNYILTKMFTFGESFENALADAQARGYAERIPDADVLGTDACRKISILSGLVDGALPNVADVPTEGITGIRSEDVARLLPLGYTVKLLGRSIHEADGKRVMVSPFVIGLDSILSSVAGVFNAVEVIGDPLGSVVFYGPGAGGGATASAVVGDLMLTMREGTSYAAPVFQKGGAIKSPDSFSACFYVSVKDVSEDDLDALFGERDAVSNEGEHAFFTSRMTLGELKDKLGRLGGTLLSYIPVLA